MSNPIHLRRARRVGMTLAAGLAFGAVPAAAAGCRGQPRHRRARSSCWAAPRSRTPARPCSTARSASRPGRRSPASGSPPSSTAHGTRTTVSPPTRSPTSRRPTTSRPRSPPASLTGIDLGDAGPLTPGAYSFSTSAQLTGALVLDAQGDPNAQFVFEIGSTLTTASGSSVLLINGASPVQRLLAGRLVGDARHLDGVPGQRDGARVDHDEHRRHAAGARTRPQRRGHAGHQRHRRARCATPARRHDAAPGRDAPTPTGRRRDPGTSPQPPPASGTTLPTRKGTARLRRTPLSPTRRRASRRRPGRPGDACTDGFTATVRGRQIKRVVFRLDGKRIASRDRSPYQVVVRATPGRHTVSARVTFKDATRRQDAEDALPRLRRRGAAAAPGPVPRSRDDPRRPARAPRLPGARRGVRALAVPLVAVGAWLRPRRAGARRRPADPGDPAARRAPGGPHGPRRRPTADARRIETVAARRPLTGVRTVLPVLGSALEPRRAALAAGPAPRTADRAHGLDPRRPHQADVDRMAPLRRPLRAPRHGPPRRSRGAPVPRRRRRLLHADAARPVLRRGGRRARRRPTPAARSPWRLSARSDVLQEFDGGPGQIAIHGTGASATRSAPRPRTAACGSAPRPSPGSRDASAAASPSPSRASRRSAVQRGAARRPRTAARRRVGRTAGGLSGTTDGPGARRARAARTRRACGRCSRACVRTVSIADLQVEGDLRVGATLPEQLQHVALALGQQRARDVRCARRRRRAA